MRAAIVYFHGEPAGYLIETTRNRSYRFVYAPDYSGGAISVNLPLDPGDYNFEKFPSFFDGLLPEGIMLDSLLKSRKIDADDLFGQLIATGGDLVGAVTVEAVDALPDNI